VPNIPEEGLHVDFAEHPVILASQSLLVTGPIEGMISVQKLGNVDVHVRGSLLARIVLPCGRCLNTFEYRVESEFYIDCTHDEKNPVRTSGQEHMLYGEELNLHFYQGDTIEVNEIIESQIHLEIPMVPLCKEACLGLCPTCGEDLNLGPHTKH
jgi:uncharacterized protein